MKLISWNVNGLRACLTHGFAESFAALDADIFSVQETKMQPGQADFAPEGYTEYTYSAEKKGYSGTACWCREVPLAVTMGIGIEHPGLFRQLLVPNIKKLDCNVVMTLNDNETLGTLLENGNMDLVVTTKDIPNRNVQYELLGTSRFILVAGGCTDISELPDLNLLNKKKIEAWLQKQVWYNTVYGEHLSSFWKLNFGRTPRFTPNYVLPDKYSIVCCLRNGTGLAVLPESLCREFLLKGEIKEVWGGYTEMKNTLFLGQRKNTLYMNEIKELKKLLRTEFLKTHPTTQN